MTAYRARYVARSYLSVSPAVYIPFARWKYRHMDHRVVDTSTELVIDGFQRSGNTFAVTAFDMAQHRPVRLVHHLHAAAQIVRAVSLRVPTILLVREPVDAVASHLMFEPLLTARLGLEHWIRFHERVRGVLDGVYVAGFTSVTDDFGKVIAGANARFGTAFDEFEHTPENERECFRRIEQREIKGRGAVIESVVPRPSATRDADSDRIRAALLAPRLRDRVEVARHVYRTIVSGDQ